MALRLPTFSLRLNDDARKSQRSELTPDDLETEAPEATESEEDIVQMVMDGFKESAESRAPHERTWLECEAMRRGNQWIEWSKSKNCYVGVHDDSDPYRRYFSVNLIRPIVRKLRAYATSSEPTADIKPASPLPVDQGAAAEVTDALADIDLDNDANAQLKDWVGNTITVGTAFLKHYWDADAETLVWSIGDDGQMDVKAAKAGRVKTVVCPAYEIYLDPDARQMRDVRRGWHVKRRSLTYIQEKYGKYGFLVKADKGLENFAGYIDQRLDSMDRNGGFGGSDHNDKNSAYVYEYWEEPSPRYKKGRMIPVAGGRLLVDPAKCDWPYETKKFTEIFVPLRNMDNNNSPWGDSSVEDLIDPQRQYNNIWTRINENIDANRITVMVHQTSLISTDSYHTKRNLQKIVWDGGIQPDYQQPPGVGEDWFTALDRLAAVMQDISGVHDISQGKVPSGVESGNAIELLQQSDNTMQADLIANIESAVCTSAQTKSDMVAQFYAEPRLIAVSQNADPQAAQIAAHDFRHVQAGGQVRVSILPGSALPKTPAARDQKLLDLYKSGAFAPQNLPATALLLKEMNLDTSDDLNTGLAQVIQQQTQAAQQAAQAPQAAAQAAEEQKAAAQLQDHQNAQQLQGQKDQAAVNLELVKQQGQAHLLDAENEYELTAQENDKKSPAVTLSLKGNATPAEIVSGGEAIGLDAGTEADAKAANAPAPVMGAGGGAKPGAVGGNAQGGVGKPAPKVKP